MSERPLADLRPLRDAPGPLPDGRGTDHCSNTKTCVRDARYLCRLLWSNSWFFLPRVPKKIGRCRMPTAPPLIWLSFSQIRRECVSGPTATRLPTAPEAWSEPCRTAC